VPAGTFYAHVVSAVLVIKLRQLKKTQLRLTIGNCTPPYSGG